MSGDEELEKLEILPPRPCLSIACLACDPDWILPYVAIN